MSIVPLVGHEPLRQRFREAIARGALPASLLFEGSRGVGKQRLALWLGQLLLCEGDPKPCETCQPCRFATMVRHPDLHWYFPRPRLKDADPDLRDVEDDYGEAIAERVEAHGLYAPPSGSEGIYVATVRAIVHQAAMTPAMARRKFFVVGDADRMVSQEGSDQAANAFLKLLEEPPADTTIVLTSSQPGALLPTIRSRVVNVRIPRLADEDVAAFLAHPAVARSLGPAPRGMSDPERIRSAAGAPGALLTGAAWEESLRHARRLLEAVDRKDRAAIYSAAMRQGVAGARGSFSDTLDALTVLLHDRVRSATQQPGEHGTGAFGAARAVEVVAEIKEMAEGNVSPQLASAHLLRRLGELL